jgi:hypothetical protein
MVDATDPALRHWGAGLAGDLGTAEYCAARILACGHDANAGTVL